MSKSTKVLVVFSVNRGDVSPFISEQVDSLIKHGIVVSNLKIKGKGILGYYKNLKYLKKSINEFSPHLVHAHYGLSGLLATFQNQVPVIITFHGSDINNIKTRLLSLLANYRSTKSIFVSQRLKEIIHTSKGVVIPCGVDLELFKPGPKAAAREYFGFKKSRKYILFSSSFDNKVKNYPLARKSISLISINMDVELIELKGYTRQEISRLMRAVDLLLVTSISEGSPQVIKEAIASRLPIVSTPVGDVSDHIEFYPLLEICPFNEKKIADAIIRSLGKHVNFINSNYIFKYDNNRIAKDISNMYMQILSKSK